MSDYDWAKKPTIITAPELRARDLEPISVGELMADLTLQSLKQFPLRNGSLERLKLERQLSYRPVLEQYPQRRGRRSVKFEPRLGERCSAAALRPPRAPRLNCVFSGWRPPSMPPISVREQGPCW